MNTIVLLTVLVLALGGALLWDRFSQQRHVARLAQKMDAPVVAGPAGVICHGDLPPGNVPHRITGALVVSAEQFVFAGQRVADFDVTVPLTAIRWVGVRTNVTPKWTRMIETRALVVHLETDAGWRVYTFTDGQPEELGRRLAEAAGVPLHNVGTAYEDFGPVYAGRLELDSAGGWRVLDRVDFADLPPDWDSFRNTLYLAPDRLLYDWQHPVLVADMRQVDAYSAGHMGNPFDEELLRVEYETPDGTLHVAGFLVRDAADWADEIAGLMEPSPEISMKNE